MPFPSVSEEIMNNPYLGVVGPGIAQGAPNPWRRQDTVNNSTAVPSTGGTGNMFPAQTALVVPAVVTQITGQPPATGSVTINPSTDAFLIRPDNGIWDNTNSVWLSVDKTNIGPTPRFF